jgi:hypothetical protein
MLTKELLTAKRAELKAAYEKATAEMNAFGGALQFCDFLIAELDKPAAETKEDLTYAKENTTS